MNLRIISAGAGSGKTYRLTSELVGLLKEGVRASGIIATTFTKKAAAELQERVRVRLLEEGLTDQADQLNNALIGTVHGLGVKLLQRFAFEAGVAPDVGIIADEDQQLLFNQSLATVLTAERVTIMEELCDRLGLHKRERYDWRRELRSLTEVARANDFSDEVLERSKQQSFSTFNELLHDLPVDRTTDWEQRLASLLKGTISRLTHNADETKKTKTVIDTLRNLSRTLELRGFLHWHEWAKISKTKVGAKSKEDVEDLLAFAAKHVQHPSFRQDIEAFIHQIFDGSRAAIAEYDRYKKQRGLIDYTDMEVLVSRLLDQPVIQEVLAEEIDLLMVDEFQDTSPIQLDIFLKLSRLAGQSIWVGDPKQSIYGFRGAAPELMQAVINAVGGIQPQDIQTHSWRSREDLVKMTNALFCKAFDQLPPAQVALQPKRRKAGDPQINQGEPEPISLGYALHHWHFNHTGTGKRPPGSPWMEHCLSATLKEFLEEGTHILPKGQSESRIARPGDVAVLCRSNATCQKIADALHRVGLKAAIARSGLLNTAEAKLILACLKYLLHHYDSLSVAEILLLASGQTIEKIIQDRLDFLQQPEQRTQRWGASDAFVASLNELRETTLELSSAETLDFMLETLDLRRIIASWGNAPQRLANVEALRKMALQYEEGCNRMHTAASTGGFLLWLAEQNNKQTDLQGSGENDDAINVLTYHKSKGLEWPIVVCYDLEGQLRASVWGVDIVAERDTVDLNQVLAHRWLRYWVNPYADQGRGTLLADRIAECETQKMATRQALQEESRLLYVGITRARDYLILPSRKTDTRWLNRVWHKGEQDFPTLDPHSEESPWEWEGAFLRIQTGVWEYEVEDEAFVPTEQPAEATLYFTPKSGLKDFPTAQIDVAVENFDKEVNVKPGDSISYAAPLQMPEGVDQYLLAKAVKAYFSAYRTEDGAAHKTAMAKGLMQRFQVEDMAPSNMVQQGQEWFQLLQRQFQPTKIYRKYPIRYYHRGRLFNKVIDLLLETPNGLVIVQNSGFAGTEQRKQKQRALQNLGSWSYLSRMAVQELWGTSSCRVFVHFVLSGQLIELVEKK